MAKEQMPRVRSRWSPRIAYLAFEGESLTQQHFKDAVDINNILAKYRKTGIIEHVKRAKAIYGDFTELAEYTKNLDKVAKAQQSFEMLPAELRNQFKNSIPGFFEYIQDPKNKEQCIAWGIFEKDEEAKAGTPAAPAPAEPEPKK